MAVEQFNEEHGDEFKITLEEFDTQGDPAQAPTVLDEYIGNEEILGLVGPAFSGETRAVLPTLDRGGPRDGERVGHQRGAPRRRARRQASFHRVLPDDAAQAAGVAKYLDDRRSSPTTIAIVHDNSEYGKGLAVDQLAAAARRASRSSPPRSSTPRARTSRPRSTPCKAANPDAIFYGGYYEEAGQLKKQLADAGVEAPVHLR